MALPTFWQHAWDAAGPRLRSISTTLDGAAPAPQGRNPRVGQLDSELLDQELLQLLREPIYKSLDTLRVARSRARFEPELTLLIQAILYKYSIWDAGASYGARLQNLHYTLARPRPRSSLLAPSRLPRNVLLAHAALTILLPYAHLRLRTHALSVSWPDAPSFSLRRRVWEALSRIESLHAFLALVNFCAFLCNGRYRTLVDRMLGMRLTPVARVANRNVSYEFMNRQMVWHAFTEFLLFFLPIINTRKLRRSTRKALANLRELPIFRGPLRSDDDKESTAIGKGRYASLAEDQCAICAEDAATLVPAHPSMSTHTHPLNTPYVTSCDHTYCYTCVADRMLRAADDGEEYWECLRCDARVKHVQRLEDRNEEGTGTSEYSGCDLDEMSLNSEDTFGTFSSDDGLSE